MRRNLGIIACLMVVNASLPVFAQAAQPAETESSASVSPRPDKTIGSPAPPLITTKDGEDCEGQAPQAGAITALLRKLVRGSNQEPGVQCPNPPVPEHHQPQEKQE